MDMFAIERALIKMQQRSNVNIFTSHDNAFKSKYAGDLLLCALWVNNHRTAMVMDLHPVIVMMIEK